MRAGNFASLEDLSDRVRGIGRKRLETLQAAGLRVAGQSGGARTVVGAGVSDSRKSGLGHAEPAAIATPLITLTEPNL